MKTQLSGKIHKVIIEKRGDFVKYADGGFAHRHKTTKELRKQLPIDVEHFWYGSINGKCSMCGKEYPIRKRG